ncbi:MAG: DUF983 domain-containing protein [Anaerolineales bacterium]|nr:DUF983 domain-containing protein [Anaerolineales bacterium]
MKHITSGKCPHCLEGSIFASAMKMNEHCPVCGIKFEREDGYFLVSIFIGYILSFAILIPEMLLLYWLLNPTTWIYVIVASVTLIVAAPLIFRYGRIIWLHIDELLDPRITEDDKLGRTLPPHGINLMLLHENETADHWYQRKSADTQPNRKK